MLLGTKMMLPTLFLVPTSCVRSSYTLIYRSGPSILISGLIVTKHHHTYNPLDSYRWGPSDVKQKETIVQATKEGTLDGRHAPPGTCLGSFKFC